MNDEVKQRLQKTETWIRVLFMLLFIIILEAVKFSAIALAIFQSVSVVLTGQTNAQLLRLGRQLAVYARQIIAFLTFNGEQRPFPFSSWPGETDDYVKNGNQGD